MVILVSLPAVAALAADPTPDPPQASGEATGTRGDAELPALDFLEYLGEWDSDGEWVDPTELEELLDLLTEESGQ